MEYKLKDQVYELIGPGTAGIAQRISSEESDSERIENRTTGLFALVCHNLLKCGHNQY